MRPCMALIVAAFAVLAFLAAGVGPIGPSHPSGSSRMNFAWTDQNSSVTCGVFGAHPGTAPYPDPNYTIRITVIWDQLCVNGTFVSLLSEWGNFYVAYPDSGTNASYLSAANLTPGAYGNASVPVVPDWDLTWWSLCSNASVAPIGEFCAHSADWSGNLTTDRFAGPFFSQYLGREGGYMPGPHPPESGLEGSPSNSAAFLLAAAMSIGGAVGVLALIRCRSK
jgi:hypothetical protein